MPRVIDIHTHVFPHYADLAVAAMDRCGIEASVVLAWHDGFGAGLQRHLAAFAKYPGRFITFGNVDFSRINEPGFGHTAAAQMERDAAAGMRGLKVYKALGLDYRRPDGTFWRPNDPELHGEYAWWTYYNKGLPSCHELLGDRLEMAARHRGTTFIFPHCAEKADSLDCAAEDLEAHPNIVYDFSARVPELARSARRAAHAREFFTAYADRIVFGTDVIFDDTNVPTGQQAQILYQPGEIPLNGADPRGRYIETTGNFIRSNIDFITSSQIQTAPPFKRSSAPFAIHGLGLSEDVAEKILYENAARLLALKKDLSR